MSFAWRQFQHAVKILDGPSDQRERLTAACYKLVKLRVKDVPAEIGADFARLTGNIGRYPAKNVRQEVRNHVEALNEAEVAAAVRSIHAMHDAVAVYQPHLFGNAGVTGTPRFTVQTEQRSDSSMQDHSEFHNN